MTLSALKPKSPQGGCYTLRARCSNLCGGTKAIDTVFFRDTCLPKFNGTLQTVFHAIDDPLSRVDSPATQTASANQDYSVNNFSISLNIWESVGSCVADNVSRGPLCL